ncbi:hypothetical protein [Subtercola endophyticus]|uniref:hypothetical protein n=1 Tax=Subtercola endophyticus TaxID=2895559 RepID=UPI001E336C49|nr:hypothetical protein [Subtercola endophyticus]UFS58175.1 hypothetical protein LQ955_14280 [Subtercola endophyticus]
MASSGNERAILKRIELIEDPEVCFIPDPTDEAVAFLSAVRDFSLWTQSERPDFYTDGLRFTVEVMRVDDHPKVGNLHNPTLAREAELEREIRAAFPSVSPDIPITVIANTGLPTEDDHNFTAYRDSFARIVGKHVANVTAYREHHPGYVLALLVHDESSAYVQAEDATEQPANGVIFPDRAHPWFLDAHFTQIVAESEADYFIWHTPNKHLWRMNAFGRRAKVDLPSLVVYDIAAMADWNDQEVYDPLLIVSAEE